MNLQVFSGSDSVLLGQAVRAAIKAALADQPADFALAELSEPDYNADDQWSIAPLIDAAQTPPMLTDRRVVVGHHLARFSTGDSVEPLLRYLDDPLDTTHLILVWSRGPALNKRTSGLPKKLTEALKAMKVTVTKTDVGNREADAYIDAKLREAGLRLDRGARRLLGDHLGDDVNRLGGILASHELRLIRRLGQVASILFKPTRIVIFVCSVKIPAAKYQTVEVRIIMAIQKRTRVIIGNERQE